MRIALISCEVFYREMSFAVSRSCNTVDAQFLPKGLHDIGSKGMLERLQQVVDDVEAQSDAAYDAIALGYGLCNNGLDGLVARSCPLVLPRAHDCISLFMGSRHRYKEYFKSNPGTYFKTSGWIERGEASGELRQISISHQQGLDNTYQDMVEKYGEENAEYLYSMLGNHTDHYDNLAFIEMGVEGSDRFERESRETAAEREWKFDHIKGDMGLLQGLVDAKWNEEDFLVVPPGRCISVTYDDNIVSIGDVQ